MPSHVVARTAFALFAVAGSASAQLITPKTLPVAQGDQFMIFPTQRIGMGSPSIALADTLLDPFINPAKITRVGRMQFYGAPVFYTISSNSGAGRTLPIGSMGKAGKWTGALAMAVQQLDRGSLAVGAPERLSDRSTVNQYASGVVGRRFDSRGISLGGSMYVAGLRAIDGVDFLYANSQNIDQSGHMVDMRVGLTKEWSGDRALEVLLLHNRFDMTHDVSYVDFVFDPVQRIQVRRDRIEHNQDRTHAYGVHLGYERPLAEQGWRIGWSATGNVLSHPKIPNYEIQNIPRDPGTTWAYNLGFGLSRVLHPATFGLDVIYEPMWSHTWADAATDTPTQNGRVIPKGGKTVENDFRFSNAIIRIGVDREAEIGTARDPRTAGMQFGLAMRAINYDLDQVSHVGGGARSQHEDWVEWTPTWGLRFRFPELEIRYSGRYTTGVGRPGVSNGGIPIAVDALTAAGSSIIAAPSGPLTLQNVHVITHQISFSVPMR
jgi:hypothetical protein